MSNRRTIASTAVITFLLTSALWIGVIFLFYWSAMSSPPAFQVDIEAPDEVALNEEFDLVVNVINASDSNLTLGSIDVYSSLLDGFEVISIEPFPNETSEMFGLQSSYFSHKLAGGEQITVTYSLQAKEEGLWIGDIDCCTPFENFVTVSKAIKVTSE